MKNVLNIETSLEHYFADFEKHIIGRDIKFNTPFGRKKIVYADWIASGRAYAPIENCVQSSILPYVANTHTEATITGTLMSKAYEEAKQIVKKHVNADDDDILIFCGSGMTACVNKLQRILGLRIPERVTDYVQNRSTYFQLEQHLKPVIFLTHMEHHSNHISWLETIADVEIIQPSRDGNVDLRHFTCLLEKYKERKNKIAAVTACSNVTGIQTPFNEIARLIHAYGGLCFVDFACSAPYIHINMHPIEQGSYLDAIYFSPHKFLGGVGTPGVLIFNKSIYDNKTPDHPGGGTIVYSNPWKEHEYVSEIEQKEDGGTPPFLGAIKVAMSIRLKEKMGIENMLEREKEILNIVINRFEKISNIKVLAGDYKKRIGVVSFIILDAHYNLIVKILNDRFGIQARGGCSCAGTYGHILLNVDKEKSHQILHKIRSNDFSNKPGWVRLSIHPCMSNDEVNFVMDAIEETACHWKEWEGDYKYDAGSNMYFFTAFESIHQEIIEDWIDSSFSCDHSKRTIS